MDNQHTMRPTDSCTFLLNNLFRKAFALTLDLSFVKGFVDFWFGMFGYSLTIIEDILVKKAKNLVLLHIAKKHWYLRYSMSLIYVKFNKLNSAYYYISYVPKKVKYCWWPKGQAPRSPLQIS